MANRQTTPFAPLEGKRAGTGIRAYPAQERAMRIATEDPEIGIMGQVVGMASIINEERRRVEKENEALTAQATVRGYQAAMKQAAAPEQIDEIANASELDLARMAQPLLPGNGAGKEFWQQHGEKVLAANRADAAKIKQDKGAEFGKSSLQNMLANAQNMLADASGAEGEELLIHGADAIARSPFLSPEEKESYHASYLKNGIVNLALNDPETARRAAEKYMNGEKGELNRQIGEVEKRRNSHLKQQEEEAARQQELLRFNDAQKAWQLMERGTVNPAQFYVLTGSRGDDILWGMHEKRSQAPLAEAYRLMRKMNQGEKLSASEVQNAGNFLISAYKQKKLNLDDAAAWQDRLAQQNGGDAVGREADRLADRVFGEDAPELSRSPQAQAYMEQKAQQALGLHQAYRRRQSELLNEAQAQGAALTAYQQEQLGLQALKETKEALGLAEDKNGAPAYSTLRRELQQAYSGNDEEEIWKRFFAAAPKSEDKAATLREIALQQQRRELHYPQFGSYAEVQRAGLEPGEKFYFKGRLAVMKG